ncbi:unnamed protein product [Trichobilharzia szidati]|nr:unnamed protein product [Trichobilharzia szidati]
MKRQILQSEDYLYTTIINTNNSSNNNNSSEDEYDKNVNEVGKVEYCYYNLFSKSPCRIYTSQNDVYKKSTPKYTPPTVNISSSEDQMNSISRLNESNSSMNKQFQGKNQNQLNFQITTNNNNTGKLDSVPSSDLVSVTDQQFNDSVLSLSSPSPRFPDMINSGDNKTQFSNDYPVNNFTNKLELIQKLKTEISHLKQANLHLAIEIDHLDYESKTLQFHLNNQGEKNNQLIKENMEYILRVTENQSLQQTVDKMKQQLNELMHRINTLRYERREFRAECVRSEYETRQLVEEISRLELNRNKNLEQLEYLRCKIEQMEIFQEDMLKHKHWMKTWQEISGIMKVIVRIKSSLTSPATTGEYQTADTISKFPVETGCLVITNHDKLNIYANRKYKASSTEMCTFEFNKILLPNTSQCEVYFTVSSQIHRLLDGYNVTLLCYGVCGSGKTHTCCGTPNDPGIASFAVNELITLAKNRSMHQMRIYASFIEIYNEHIYCMLSKQPISLKDTGDMIHIEGQIEQCIQSIHDFNTLLFQIISERKKLLTQSSNYYSSRSHFFIFIKLVLEKCKNQITSEYLSTLIIGDLANYTLSNFKIPSSGNNNNNNNTLIKQENYHIQKSLVMLTNILHGLRKQNSFNVYRGSKLTELLKPCFNGDSYLTLILNITDNPAEAYFTNAVLEVGKSLMCANLSRPIKHNKAI